MKKYYIAAVLGFICTQANAGEFVYDYSAVADGFYGYTQYADKYNHLYQRNNTPISAEINTSIGYDFGNDNQISIGADAPVAHGKKIKDYNHGDWGENLYASLATKYGELSVGQIYNAEIYFDTHNKRHINKVTICDSLKVLNFSVEQIAKDFDLPIRKLELDYNEIREIGHELTPHEIDYIRNDVEIMARALEILFDNQLNKITIASNALACPIDNS